MGSAESHSRTAHATMAQPHLSRQGAQRASAVTDHNVGDHRHNHEERRGNQSVHPGKRHGRDLSDRNHLCAPAPAWAGHVPSVVCMAEGINPCLLVSSFGLRPAAFAPIRRPAAKGPQLERLLWPANFNTPYANRPACSVVSRFPKIPSVDGFRRPERPRTAK